MRNGTLLLTLLAILAIVACSGGSEDVAPVDTQATSITDSAGTVDPSPTSSASRPAPDGEPLAEESPIESTQTTRQYSAECLPIVDLTFRVLVPENTPPNDTVYVATFATNAFDMTEHVALENEGNGYWRGTVSVAPGSILMYAYDRWDGVGCCEVRELTREGLNADYLVGFRLLNITDSVAPVEDVVGLWNDLRTSFDEGSVRGVVTERGSGAPLIDALVSVGGAHSATGFDGSFEVTGLPVGQHHVVVYSATGEIMPEQRDVSVDSGQQASVDIKVSPAEFVNVRFEADLPEQMPADAVVRIAGNLRQLGGRPRHPTGNGVPDGAVLPQMSIDDGKASIDLQLPIGAYVSYTYTIGPVGLAASATAAGATVWHSFVVGGDGSGRIDRVESFGNPDWPLTTLNVTVPSNTTPGVPISFMDGPGMWFSKIGPNRWSTVVGNMPPGTEFSYGYLMGASRAGVDDSPDVRPEGLRAFTIGESDRTIEDIVTKWVGLPDPTVRQSDGSLDVTFRVSVPLDTPADAEVILTGSRPALGSGVAMTQNALNPWLYEATVNFGHDGELQYRYETSRGLTSEVDYTVKTDFDGQIVNDSLPRWNGLERPDERSDFMAGYYTPDFWSTEFETLGPPTFEHIGLASGNIVPISSVWSYGQSQPIPTLEQYSFRAGSVATPIETIREQAALIHQLGLQVFLAPQFNMEQAPGGFGTYNSEKSIEWWQAWIGLAENLWLWNATVAEEIDAELLMLPGPLFHVYDRVPLPEGDTFFAEFDGQVADLVGRVREVYSGQLIISGGNSDYEFPELADVIGMTTFDLGVPELPATATVEEWKAAYGANFVERADSIHERWGNDVVFYTIHVPPQPTPDDPGGEIAQANRLEAIFQLIAERPWIKGSFSWSFEYVDAPGLPADNQRSKLGEAVLAKWYDRLSGR